VFFEAVAQLAVETDADGDVLVVEQADELVERFLRLAELLAFVRVDVYRWIFRPRGAVLGEDEHRARPELVEGKRAAVLAVERLLGEEGCFSQRRGGAKEKERKK
jgi:hypothetical protein